MLPNLNFPTTSQSNLVAFLSHWVFLKDKIFSMWPNVFKKSNLSYTFSSLNRLPLPKNLENTLTKTALRAVLAHWKARPIL